VSCQSTWLNNPEHYDAAIHGLMLGPTESANHNSMEGVGGDTEKSATIVARKTGEQLLSDVPGLGEVGQLATKVADTADRFQNFLFHEYIPSLKIKTYEHAPRAQHGAVWRRVKERRRNAEQVKHLTAIKSTPLMVI